MPFTGRQLFQLVQIFSHLLIFIVFLDPVCGRHYFYPGFIEMLEIVNAHRQKHGASAVCISEKLTQSAYDQSLRQALEDRMTHDAPLNVGQRISVRGFNWSMVGENVHFHYGNFTPKAHHIVSIEGWKKSPPHNENILDPNWTHFGSAMVELTDGKQYWTQHFARPLEGVSEPCIDQSKLKALEPSMNYYRFPGSPYGPQNSNFSGPTHSASSLPENSKSGPSNTPISPSPKPELAHAPETHKENAHVTVSNSFYPSNSNLLMTAAALAGLGLGAAYHYGIPKKSKKVYQDVKSWFTNKLWIKGKAKKQETPTTAEKPVLTKPKENCIPIRSYMIRVQETVDSLRLNDLLPLLTRVLTIICPQDLEMSAVHKGLPVSYASSIADAIIKPSIPSIMLEKFLFHSGMSRNFNFIKKSVCPKVAIQEESYQLSVMFGLGKFHPPSALIKITPLTKRNKNLSVRHEFAHLITLLLRNFHGNSSRKIQRDFDGIRAKLAKNPIRPLEIKLIRTFLERSQCLDNKHSKRCIEPLWWFKKFALQTPTFKFPHAGRVQFKKKI